MTSKELEARATEETKRLALKFDTARQIRALLDGARKAYGEEDFDADDLESVILDLVTGE